MVRDHVLFEVALVAELVAADGAAEVLLHVVPVGEVAAQVALLTETLATQRAAVLEEALVNSRLVQLEVVQGTECLAAGEAVEHLAGN